MPQAAHVLPVLAVIRGITLFCQFLIAAAVASAPTPASREGSLPHSPFPSERVLASCPLASGGVAVATGDPGIGGVYYIVVPGSEPAKLGEFAGEADLACYSSEKAKRFNGVIAESEGISGGILPSGSDTVICGFLSSVEAECWQFDHDGNLKPVGGWTT